MNGVLYLSVATTYWRAISAVKCHINMMSRAAKHNLLRNMFLYFSIVECSQFFNVDHENPTSSDSSDEPCIVQESYSLGDSKNTVGFE